MELNFELNIPTVRPERVGEKNIGDLSSYHVHSRIYGH